MKASDIMQNLDGIVLYDGRRYRRTAGIIRFKPKRGFYYTAELHDLRANSVTIAPLEHVTIEGGGK